MKNIKLLLFLLCGFILCSNIVKAEGPFLLDWETPADKYTLVANNIPFKDGYVTYGFDGDVTHVVYYDKSGKELYSTEVEGFVLSMGTKEDYIYGFYYNYDSESVAIKFDNKLNIVKEITVSNRISMPPYYYYLYGYRLIYIGDKVATYGLYEDKITLVDTDLTNVTSVRMSEANLKKYAPNLAYTMELFDEIDIENEMLGIVFSDSKNNQIVYASNKYICDIDDDDDISSSASSIGGAANVMQLEQVLPATSGPNPDPACYKTSIHLLDKNFNVIWDKDLKDYISVANVKIAGGYVIVSAVKADNFYTDLLVFDMKGNLVQTISNNSSYYGIEETPRGFMVVQNTCPVNEILGTSMIGGGTIVTKGGSFDKSYPSAIKLNEHAAPPTANCKTKHQVYYLFHRIETKVNGKGKIEVIGQQKPGEPVTFKVTPEEGYVLSKVIVTDANGNKVTFKNNIFTMPNADVTIEAVFVKKSIIPINPDTDVLPTIIITFAALGSFAFLLFFNKKYQFLK